MSPPYGGVYAIGHGLEITHTLRFIRLFNYLNEAEEFCLPLSSFVDELRCHCNLPVCVTTGYMCKSAMGTCFSEIVDRTDLSKSRHGCLELLSR